MRAAGDLYGRSLVGPLFYVVACIVSAWVAGTLHLFPLTGWLPEICFVALFLLRRANRPPTDFADPAPYIRWRWRHWALIHSGCLLWAAVATYLASIERDSWLPFTTVVAITITLGSAVNQAFSMERRQAAISLFLFLAPPIVLCFLVPRLRPIAVVLAVFLFYQLSSLRRLAKEWDAQVATEFELHLSRVQVERLTRVDALTGLANRRAYEDAYPKAWQQAARARGNIALLVFDIDHFKALNDNHGHLAGDACLQHFAALMKECFRRTVDLPARIGGEEFVVVLPGSTAREAEAMAETLRAKLETRPCAWQGRQLPMTVSIGVGSADWSTDASPDTTFARVDAACYEAKMSGRNRVSLSLAPARPVVSH